MSRSNLSLGVSETCRSELSLHVNQGQKAVLCTGLIGIELQGFPGSLELESELKSRPKSLEGIELKATITHLCIFEMVKLVLKS